jgi:hypothetical protein
MKAAWLLAVLTPAAAAIACGGPTGGRSAFDDEDAGVDGTSYGSGAADSGPPSGDDGGSPLLGLDASAVSPTCMPGLYAGTYTGTNDSSKVGGPTDFPIAGPISLDLVAASMNGEDFLMVNDGAFDLAWGTTSADASSGLIVISAMLNGNLNCENGAFSAGDPMAPWSTLGIPSGTATVTFTGSYTASTATIAGTFAITDSLSTSTGTWSVTLMP